MNLPAEDFTLNRTERQRELFLQTSHTCNERDSCQERKSRETEKHGLLETPNALNLEREPIWGRIEVAPGKELPVCTQAPVPVPWILGDEKV